MTFSVSAFIQDHAWEATLSIYTPEMSPANANLTGSLTKTFDVSEGVAVFDDLQFDLRGRYSLYVEVTSTPADYSLSGYSSVIEISSPGEWSVCLDSDLCITK